MPTLNNETKSAIEAEIDVETSADGWGQDANLGSDSDDENGEKNDFKSIKEGSDNEDGGWDVGDEDISIPDHLKVTDNDLNQFTDSNFVAPNRGTCKIRSLVANSIVPVDHVAVGSFETAFRLLNDQVRFILNLCLDLLRIKVGK